MAKTAAERVREYRERKRASGEYQELLDKDRARKEKERAKQRKTARGRAALRSQNNKHKRAQRLRAKNNAAPGSPRKGGFVTKQHFGKCKKKVAAALPASPTKRREVLVALAQESGLDLKQTNERKSVVRVARQVSPEVRQAVVAYYQDDAITFQSPTYKVTREVQLDGEIVDVPVRYLTMTLREAHALFIDEHPDMEIGRAKFCELRPKHVLLQKNTPHNVCTCCIHENIRFLLKALHSNSVQINTEFREFIAQVVCDPESEECMRSGCPRCPGLSLISLDEIQAKSHCAWKAWDTIDKQCVLQNLNGTLEGCLKKLQDLLPQFLSHTFTKRAQSKSFKEARENVQPDEAVIQIDYAENYGCKHQNEVQAAHWTSVYVSIFTAVVWYKDEKNLAVKKSFALVSDYAQHEKYSVHVSLQLLLGEVKFSLVPDLKKVHIYSDGAASQFKQRYTLYNITHLAEELDIGIEWNFFESYHGKGAVDAIGGTVKKMAWNAARSGKTLTSASHIVSLCQEKKTKTIVIEIPPADIVQCKEFLDKRWAGIKPIPQLLKVHHVQVLKRGTILFAWLTDACSPRNIHNFCSK